MLIQHQPDTIQDEDEDSNTPLHLACTHGHLGVVKVLVEADADVEARWDTPSSQELMQITSPLHRISQECYSVDTHGLCSCWWLSQGH